MEEFLKRRIVNIGRRLGSGPRRAKWFIKLRNHCDSVLREYYSDGIDHRTNGEDLLLRRLAGEVDTFVDVGASVGEWSHRAFVHFGEDVQAVLYEPRASAFSELEKEFSDSSNVVMESMAVADQNGSTFFVERTHGEHSSLQGDLGEDEKVTTSYEVQITTLSAASKQWPFDAVDFLKVDVEGFDLDVLRGGGDLFAKQKVGFVQFEYNSSWKKHYNTLGEALRLLRGYEYDVFLLKSEGIFEYDYSKLGEFWRYANFVGVPRSKQYLLEDILRGPIIC